MIEAGRLTVPEGSLDGFLHVETGAADSREVSHSNVEFETLSAPLLA